MFVKILTRYLLKELFQVFLLTLSILTLIFFVIFSGKMIQKYSQYISLVDIIVMTPYTLILSASFTIPLAMLAATTMVYGRMAYEKEILVLRIAGIHFRTMFRPAFGMGIILCCICFYINADFVPTIFVKQTQLQYKALELVLRANFSSEETTIDYIPNLHIYYKRLENGQFYHLIIQHTKEEQVVEEIVADTGRLVYNKETLVLTFYLKNGTTAHISRRRENEQSSKSLPSREARVFFKEISIPISLEERDNQFIPQRAKYKVMSVLYRDMKRLEAGLNTMEQKLKSQEGLTASELEYYKTLRRDYISHAMEWHQRWANSLTSFLVVFLGSPLGILISHNNRLVSFAVGALPVILVYYPLEAWGTAMGKNRTLSPFWAVWLSMFATSFLGILILVWAYRK